MCRTEPLARCGLSCGRSCGRYSIVGIVAEIVRQLSPPVTGIVRKKSHAHDLLRPLLNSGEGLLFLPLRTRLPSPCLLLPSESPPAQSTEDLAAARTRARRQAAGRRRRARTHRRTAARRRHSPVRFPLFPSCALVLWIYRYSPFLFFPFVLPLFFTAATHRAPPVTLWSWLRFAAGGLASVVLFPFFFFPQR